MSKTIILGGGISGLVALNYTEDAVLYERNDKVAADLIDDTFPKYIHSNYETNLFCSDIGVTPKIERFRIGIYHNRKLFDFFWPPLTREEQIIMYNEYCIKKYGKVEEDKMNGFLSGRREECFISNKNDIVEKLRKKHDDRIKLNSKVTEINTQKKYIVVNGEQVSYDNLISTLPISIFGEIAKVQCPIEFLTLKCIMFECNDKNNQISKYDFIYVVDEHLRFCRVNVSKDRLRYVFEFPSTIVDEDDCRQFAAEFQLNIMEPKVKGYAFPRLLSPVNIDSVQFVGRFAVGDYRLKTEDVIKDFVR